MGTFLLNITGAGLEVTVEEISTDCSTLFIYTIQADYGDSIDITLTGDHFNESYISNGSESTFSDTETGISFNETLQLKFFLENSGSTGVFESTVVEIDNTTDSGTYTNTAVRYNDSDKCSYVTPNNLSDLADIPAEPTGTTDEYLLVWDDDTDTFSWEDASSFGGSSVSELSDLTDVNTSTPTNRNVLVADGTDWESRALTEADISDLGSYLTAEVNDLTAAVTWDDVPDANITESSVTQHEAALTITESQISDLQSYLLDITGESIGDLSDVTISSLVSGDIMYYSGSEWVNETLSGAGIAAASHTHTTSDITDLASYTGFDSRYYTESEVDALTWDASDIVSGTFADARISESSVTQHEAALTITESQISDLSHYTDEEAQDAIAAAIAAGSTTRISIGYVDGSNLFNFTVDDDLSNYDNSTTQFLSSGDNLSELVDDVGYLTSLSQSKSITIQSPTSSEDITMFFTNEAITISEMRAVVQGTSPSVTWTIRHLGDRSGTGNEVVTSGTTTTSTTTGSDVTSFNDATIPADSFVWLETTATSGTVDDFNVTLIFTQD